MLKCPLKNIYTMGIYVVLASEGGRLMPPYDDTIVIHDRSTLSIKYDKTPRGYERIHIFINGNLIGRTTRDRWKFLKLLYTLGGRER